MRTLRKDDMKNSTLKRTQRRPEPPFPHTHDPLAPTLLDCSCNRPLIQPLPPVQVCIYIHFPAWLAV